MPKIVHDENPSLSRRTFLAVAGKVAGVATLALKTAGLAFASDGLDPPYSEVLRDQDMLRIHPGKSRYFPSREHAHKYDLPLDYLRNPPPKGVRLRSSTAMKPFKHAHTLEIAQVELMDIAMGRTLDFSDSLHDHEYRIDLGNATTDILRRRPRAHR